MIELSIHFTSDEKDETSPIEVSLNRRDTGTRTDFVPFTPPLGDPELADLRWYLELFSGWPTGPDYERAERIEAQMEDWGRALRDSIITDPKAARLWQQFLDTPADGKLLTIDATDPRVLRLPWELLADEGGHIFVRRISVRRRLQQVTTVPIRAFALPVRVLVVVSRPEDAGFIDPRAVSRPLLDALDELGDQVVVEFLYPPTLPALTERLSDSKAPPVHVVHFDGHGVYDVTMGLGYLLFEDDKHRADRVDANRLGTLLYDCGVPLMALNACQSAKQEEANPYASVAARLIRAGVGSVLAMNYSVLVVAAHKFVKAFYGSLADGLTVGQAVDKGRRMLLADEKRHTLTRRDAEGKLVEETIRLRDWFLPALYQQAADPVVFGPEAPLPSREGLGEGVPLALTDPTTPGGLPPDPLHGFHGRAREMLLLERALAEHRVVVLHGFGGMGKTALAAEAGRWFHRTGRFMGGAAFVSFEHGGSLSQLCSWLGQAVSGDPNFVIGEGDPIERITNLLRQQPALVILDNFESVLGREPLMPPDELKAVLDAVYQWAVARVGNPRYGSRVLITTRDTTFNDARFGPSKLCAHVELQGLATPDALAAAVLDAHSIDRATVGRQELEYLMDHLGGHPLSLYLVLPRLREHSPVQLIARFEELLPGFTAGAAVERNESLAVSLQFSLDRLGDETRAALPDLAVFQGGALESRLLEITGMDPDLWQTARAELEQAALITAESLPGVIPPFLRFHPTLVPYLASLLPASRRAELEERYWQRYYALANYLYQADTQTPHQARAIALRELPNLRRALDLAIAAATSSPPGRGGDRGGVLEAVGFADSIARFLNVFGRWRERDAMMEKISNLQSQISSEEGVTKAEYLLLSQRGEALLQQGRAAEAEQVFRDLLERLEGGAAYETAYEHATTLVRLGRCLAVQGRPAQAIEWHRRALEEFERISEPVLSPALSEVEGEAEGSSESAKGMLGKVYTDLGDNLAAVGRFDEAQQAYETSLGIKREVDDHRGIGVTLGQLGTLALERGDLAEAARRYREALDTFRALGEPQSEAVIWHQLGRVAQKARDWDEAERCYRESLKLEEQMNHAEGVAQTCNQLALVAKGAGRPDDAERWVLRAIELGEQLGDRKGLAVRLSNLADLYLSQGRLDQAARYAHRAREIKETLDLSAEPWTTYNILAQIAEAQGRADEAAQWWRKEQESYAAYAGAAHQLPRWAPSFIAAVVAAVQGNEEARSELEQILPQLEAGGWDCPPVIRRILEGESDADALCAGLDHIDAYIVRTILAQLAGPVLSAVEGPALSEVEGEAPQTLRVSETLRVSRVSELRQQWAPVVQAVVAACQGDAIAAAQLEPLLAHFSQQDDWRGLAAALRRILSGERDPAALLPGLDPTDTLIAVDVLRALGVDISPPLEGEGLGEGSEPEGEATLDDLLGLVALACTPDAPPGLAEQLHAATRTMAADPNAPPEVRALGRALNAILSGDRAPDLSALPPELAEALRRLLSTIT
jgi:tetratricopeptide (TPR) repeat protein